jgi:hypothetical protein
MEKLALVLIAALAACSSEGPRSTTAEGTAAGETAAVASAVSVAPAVRRAQETWRKAMARVPAPESGGCFHAKRPSTTWEEVPCQDAPEGATFAVGGRDGASFAGGTGPNADWEGASVIGPISWAEGTFPSISNVAETSNGVKNSYSLQLNTGRYTTPLCSNTNNPKIGASCQGETQFVYSTNLFGGILIESWLVGYGTQVPCPPGWAAGKGTSAGSCILNSRVRGIPVQPTTSLSNIALSGQLGSTNDVVEIWLGEEMFMTTISASSIPGLAAGWVNAEFNIFGDGNGTQAVFTQADATLTVHLMMDGPTYVGGPAPQCQAASNTLETNNLSINTSACCNYNAGLPGITFVESNFNSGVPTCPPETVTSVGSAGHFGSYARSDGHAAIPYHNPSGHVAELSLIGSTWGFGDLTSITGAPGPTGDIAAYVRSDETNSVTYRASDGDIHENTLGLGSLNWQGWDLTSIAGGVGAAGDPSAYVRSDGTNAVVYRGTDARIYEISLPAGSTSWQVTDLTLTTFGPDAATAPIGYQHADGTNAVVFQTLANNHLVEFERGIGASAWSVVDLTAGTNATAAAGKARGYVRSDYTTAVVYRGTDNDIHELSLPQGSSSWQNYDLSALTGATAAAGDPSPYVRSDSWNTVVYRGSDNHIHELGLNPGGWAWQVGDLTSITGSPNAVAGPTGFVRPDLTNSVDFQTSDNHVHEMTYAGNGWSGWDLTQIAGGP